MISRVYMRPATSNSAQQWFIPIHNAKPCDPMRCRCNRAGCSNRWDTLTFAAGHRHPWAVHFPDVASASGLIRLA
jgi:hypothetical protein